MTATSTAPEQGEKGKPTRARRQLSRHLVKLKEASGLTFEQLASKKCGTRSSWSRWARRISLPGPRDVSWICDQLGAEPDLKERMVGLADASSQPTWYEQDTRGLALTRGFVTLLELEEIASRIRIFAPMMVPGLLQTPAYQRAMFDVAPGLTTSRAEQQVEVRTKRQALTIGQGIPCLVVLDECALTRKVGGAETMREQLAYLLDLTANGRADIRVLPFESGAHPASRGEFTLLEFPVDEDEPPFSYAEGYQGAECSDDDRVITDFNERWEIILSDAVPMEQFVRSPK